VARVNEGYAFMSRFKSIALAGIFASVTAAAFAADLPPPPMPQFPPPVEVGGGWYLRGDIGMTNQRVDSLSYVPQDEAISRGLGDDSFESIHMDFDSSPFFGVGVGYRFNDWFRADLTGEYRGKASFHGLERSVVDPYTDQYSATKSEWVGLANVYLDLGHWYGITPFIGAGVGFAHNTIGNYVDVGQGNVAGGPVSSFAFAGEHSKTNLAWAVHAGIAYDVTPNFTVELAYRYLNLGDAQTGTIHLYDNSGCQCVAMKFKDIDSHDMKVGVRWAFAAPMEMERPLVRKY
jgi:opacity protein-like surface antigen